MSSGVQIPQSLTTAEARSKLGQIIRRASGKNPERFLIGLRNGPQAVVLGLEDYLELIAPKPDILAQMHAISVANGTDKMTMDEIDAEIAAWREEERMANAASIGRSLHQYSGFGEP
jgi:hypothetical protein